MTFFFTLLFEVFVFWRPQEWWLTWLYGWNLLDLIVYLALLALLAEVRAGRARFPLELPQIWLLAGLWFAAILSHAAHTYFDGIMWTITDVFKFCFFTVLLFCVLDSPARLKWTAWVFVIMSGVMAVHALLQEKCGYGFANAPPIHIPEWGDRPAHTRSLFFGIFEDPNDLAQILATAIPFAFAIPKRLSFRGLLFGGGVTTLLVMGILATRSRGGYVALVAAGAVMVALMLPGRWFPAAMGGLMALALALCPYSAGYLDESACDRVDFWGQANWVFKENLLFGVGYRMFPDYVSLARAAHNAFVLCYTEMGLVGYWFWYAILQLSVVGAWRTRMALREPANAEQAWLKRFAGLGMAAMAGFCVSSYFLSRAFVYPLFFMFAMLGVLPVVARPHLPEGAPPLVGWQRDVWTYGTAGALVSILYVYLSIRLLNMGIFG
ncbi:MAG: hypothetical protein QME60_06395 [Verrucomicrobiota bacterium]|nr:hypothetical protein [Verrucomicrobiota bacterium]